MNVWCRAEARAVAHAAQNGDPQALSWCSKMTYDRLTTTSHRGEAEGMRVHRQRADSTTK